MSRVHHLNSFREMVEYVEVGRDVLHRKEMDPIYEMVSLLNANKYAVISSDGKPVDLEGF